MAKHCMRTRPRRNKESSLATANPIIHKIHATRKEKPSIDYKFFTLLMNKGNAPRQIQEAYNLSDETMDSWEIKYLTTKKYHIRATGH